MPCRTAALRLPQGRRWRLQCAAVRFPERRLHTHRLLQEALQLSGLAKAFTWSGPGSGLVHPGGFFSACVYRSKTGAPGELRIAASDLGVGRVEMTLLLPREEGRDDAIGLYERVTRLWHRGYTCHFCRLEGSNRLQVRAQVFTRAVAGPDEEDWDGVPTVSDAVELGRWLRVSMSAARDLLPSPARRR